ncbi:MAG: 50S ribosomal protein L11 methyltransferase [Bacteroidota bacterium]
MTPTYVEYHFKVQPTQPGNEILIAELGQVGFESFVEQEDGVKAYIQKADWHEHILDELYILSPDSEIAVTHTRSEIEQVNWNAEWEKNFDPIVVNNQCVVRAPFHDPFQVEFEIVIEPKMSFGTGHHETTYMMLSYLLEHDLEGQRVLDMGCGTSVLAILAEKKGATHVDAIDIDTWCVENSRENAQRNACSRIEVILGDAAAIPSEENYETIIANINRNILLSDIPVYAEALAPKGTLLLSGFYRGDLKLITQACEMQGLTAEGFKERNEWIAARFTKDSH